MRRHPRRREGGHAIELGIEAGLDQESEKDRERERTARWA